MVDSTNFDKDILDLQSELNKVTTEDTENRTKRIDIELKKGIIDLNNLTDQEQVYVHSKLHFYHYMNNPPISKAEIHNIHSKLIKMMKFHQKFDYLDK